MDGCSRGRLFHEPAHIGLLSHLADNNSAHLLVVHEIGVGATIARTRAQNCLA